MVCDTIETTSRNTDVGRLPAWRGRGRAEICPYGHTPVIVTRLLNVFVGSLISPYVFVLALSVSDRRTAVRASVMTMLFPELIFYSSAQLKDILIVFLIVYSISNISVFAAGGNLGKLVRALPVILPLFYLRVPYIFVLLVTWATGLMGYAILHRRKSKGYGWRRGVAVVSVMAAVVLSAVTLQGGLAVPSADAMGAAIDHYRNNTFGGATYSSLALRISNRLPASAAFVVMPILMLISPYPPWYFLSTVDPVRTIYFINALAWTMLLPFCLVGVAKVVWGRLPESLFRISPMLAVLIVSGASYFVRF